MTERLTVDLDEFKRVVAYLKAINTTPLEHIDWNYKGVILKIDPEIIYDWNYTGLSNCSFAQIHLIEK